MKYSHVIAMAVVVFFLGSMFGLYYGAVTIMGQNGCGGSFAKGWEAARDRLYTLGQYREEVSSLSGVIKEIKDNKITFETSLVNPLDDESLKIRTVVIDNDTQMIFKKLKTEEEYQKDKNDNEEAIVSLKSKIKNLYQSQRECSNNEGSECTVLMDEITKYEEELGALNDAIDFYYLISDFNLSEVKLGSRIRAVSLKTEKENDKDILAETYRENIAFKKEFTASKIEITESDIK